MLDLYPLQIPVYIAVSVAAQADGVVAVQQLIAGLEMYHRAVVIVHLKGHVKIYAPHQVHYLYYRLQIHHRITVHVKAYELFHVAAQGVNAVAAVVYCAPVHAVELAIVPLHVNYGVPGDTDKIYGMAYRIYLSHHDSVGISGAVVIARQEYGIYPILALGVKGGAFVLLGGAQGCGPGAGLRLGHDGPRLYLRRPLPEHIAAYGQRRRQRNSSQRNPGYFQHFLFIPHNYLRSAPENRAKYIFSGEIIAGYREIYTEKALPFLLKGRA